jgi:predicted DNA-binding transcriptional regulator AlpA
MTSIPDVLDDPVMFWRDVQPIVRQCYSTIWRQEQDGKFPRHFMHGGRVAWFKSQIRGHFEAKRASVAATPATQK